MFQGNFYVSEDGQHHNQADLAEIAELKQQLVDLQGGCAPYIMLKDATLKMAKKLLLESQAREAQLREALEYKHDAVQSLMTWCIKNIKRWSFPQYDHLGYANAKMAEALSLPHDDTALKAYRDAVIGEFVGKFKRHVGGDGEFWLHELEDFYQNTKAP